RKLDEKGIELEIRKVASDNKVKLIPLLDKDK
ncbi:PTS fructose transporter subunit IIB, partial [Listeria monocytogenes]|nr:PTS fructose transporter subunit IIB [Listeria monocytogenes]